MSDHKYIRQPWGVVSRKSIDGILHKQFVVPAVDKWNDNTLQVEQYLCAYALQMFELLDQMMLPPSSPEEAENIRSQARKILATIKSNDEPALSVSDEIMQIRREMASEGWHSEDRITDQGWGDKGKFGYSVWFTRWDWHGKQLIRITGNKACYHASTSDLDCMWEAVLMAAKIARRAYAEFPDIPPRQGADGTLSPGHDFSKGVP